MSAVEKPAAVEKTPVIVRCLYICAALLGAFAIGCLLLGPRYEISRVPLEQRAQMADFDWIGVKWIERAGYTFAGCVICIGVGYWRQRHRRPRITQGR
jgi:hypothetical protein